MFLLREVSKHTVTVLNNGDFCKVCLVWCGSCTDIYSFTKQYLFVTEIVIIDHTRL